MTSGWQYFNSDKKLGKIVQFVCLGWDSIILSESKDIHSKELQNREYDKLGFVEGGTDKMPLILNNRLLILFLFLLFFFENIRRQQCLGEGKSAPPPKQKASKLIFLRKITYNSDLLIASVWIQLQVRTENHIPHDLEIFFMGNVLQNTSKCHHSIREPFQINCAALLHQQFVKTQIINWTGCGFLGFLSTLNSIL